MAEDLIRYDLLVQDAMRDVMRRVLGEIATTGLPGEHHFTISFLTRHPQTRLSKRLAEQWPREMTIILQHQFSGLFVDADGFGVTLSFRSVPENLYVPFAAVTGFFDPSVEFGLKFDVEKDDEDEDEESAEDAPARPRPELVRDGDEEERPAALAPALTAQKKAKEPEAELALETPVREAGKIVSIDAFRKKS